MIQIHIIDSYTKSGDNDIATPVVNKWLLDIQKKLGDKFELIDIKNHVDPMPEHRYTRKVVITIIYNDRSLDIPESQEPLIEYRLSGEPTEPEGFYRRG